MDRDYFEKCYNNGYPWKWLEKEFGMSTYMLKNVAKDMKLGRKPKIYKSNGVPIGFGYKS